MSIEIQLLPVDQILIPQVRQRTTYPEDHIRSLAESIEKDGLLHAIAVTDTFDLIAGFCRLHAIKLLSQTYRYGDRDIEPGSIPVVILSGRSETELFRIEAEENIRRRNLSPIEQAQTVARLHRLLQSEHGADWTRLDTGKELDRIRESEREDSNAAREVGDAILLDSFADDPEVQKAKTKGEALRVAKKKMEKTFAEALGAGVTHKTGNLYHGSFRDVFIQLSAGPKFQGIVTDPPYGIDAQDFGAQSVVGGHAYEDSEEVALTEAENVFDLGNQLTTADAHLYMFCDIRYFNFLCDVAKSYGWQPRVSPLIWHKPNLGHAPEPGFFLRRYETLLFAKKGNRKLINQVSDVLEFPAALNKIHAAQKPHELYAHLMNASFYPGERVLDPYCGSGTIFRAAKQTKHDVVGIDVDESSINLSRLAISEN